MHAGEVLCISSNMPHGAEAMEDTVEFDIFNPPPGLDQQDRPIPARVIDFGS
jgi:hypothetical protein